VGLLILGGIIASSEYRRERLLSYLNPGSDPLGKGYQLNQALIAIGSGGVFGVGFGESTTKLQYLPEPIGDSIFAVIAEELGFIGGIFLVLLFVFLLLRGFRIAKHAPDKFASILTICFVTLIGLQVFIHIGAISGLLPLTGVPLPFISYGGTALAVFLTMCGIIANISKSSKH
jgi:cell division protein FtsW